MTKATFNVSGHSDQPRLVEAASRSAQAFAYLARACYWGMGLKGFLDLLTMMADKAIEEDMPTESAEEKRYREIMKDASLRRRLTGSVTDG